MCKQSQKVHLLLFEKVLFNEPVGTNMGINYPIFIIISAWCKRKKSIQTPKHP